MARPLRIQFEGAWYHVMNRGTNRKKIFTTRLDYEMFLALLNHLYQKYGIEIHAYCLMPNHYHLLIRTPLANLSQAMRHLNGVYTQRFNVKNCRDGALFRGRYKSILIDSDSYLLNVSRYIHLNPLAAKLCVDLKVYRWSSHNFYIYHKNSTRLVILRRNCKSIW